MDDKARADHQAQIRKMADSLALHIRLMERENRAIPIRRPYDPQADGAGRLTGLVP